MLSRRRFLLASALAAGPLAGESRPAAALDDGRLEAEVAVFAGAEAVEAAPFGFTVEPLAESGYTVPVAIAPAGAERIAALRILAPGNPLVRVATVRFGPMATGAIATRIRLARSQTVTALARTDAGRVLREDRRVDVLVGGCGFDVEEGRG
jgi:sulfur-oxidizing protein SoxY